MMSLKSSTVWIALAAAGTLAALAATALRAAPPAPAGTHRVELPGAVGKPFPYTVAVPAGWQVLAPKDKPGIWLGPADGKPPDDPRLVYVRISPVSLSEPAKIVASIKASDAADPSWSAPLVEVRQVGGVEGVLVQVETGAGDKARSILTLKMPLEKTSVDFIGNAPAAEFAKLRPVYEQVLFSVRPVAAPPAAPAPPAVKP